MRLTSQNSGDFPLCSLWQSKRKLLQCKWPKSGAQRSDSLFSTLSNVKSVRNYQHVEQPGCIKKSVPIFVSIAGHITLPPIHDLPNHIRKARACVSNKLQHAKKAWSQAKKTTFHEQTAQEENEDYPKEHDSSTPFLEQQMPAARHQPSHNTKHDCLQHKEGDDRKERKVRSRSRVTNYTPLIRLFMNSLLQPRVKNSFSDLSHLKVPEKASSQNVVLSSHAQRENIHSGPYTTDPGGSTGHVTTSHSSPYR